MEILAIIFTVALCLFMTFCVAVITDTIIQRVGVPGGIVIEDSIFTIVIICILMSYIGVLIRIVGPIYRFFLGG